LFGRQHVSDELGDVGPVPNGLLERRLKRNLGLPMCKLIAG